jgi:ribose-phosphate pyrophosphokinase
LFTGNANPKLAKRVARELGVRLGKAVVSRFSDQEIMVKIQENVKGKEVFVVQPTCFPQNDNLMELLIMAHALKRAKAKKVTAVVPWYAYARQDKSFIEGDPITAKLVAELMMTAGINRVITVHLHSDKIRNYFKIPVFNLYPEKIFVEHIKKKKIKNFVVVAPDQGVIEETKRLARKLGAPTAFIK